MNTVFFPAVTATAPVERTRTQTGPIPFSTRVDSVGLTRPHVIQIELPKAASGPYAAGCVAWSPSPLTRANAIAPDGRELRGTGTLEGRVADKPRGSAGFGFDPVFVPDGEERTVSELGDTWKSEHSHRARAAAALLPQLLS